ncbi:MAG: copper chaperone PCu(A)C [Acidimicrobiia bacterium]|nr:copper chaperone PCu(A)C [Acidimicrobiia bacterium]
MKRLLASVLLAVAVGACGGGSGVAVSDAVIAEPAGAATALYLEIENSTGATERLLSARTDVAVAEIHRSFVADNQMHMESVAEVEVGGGEVVAFEPGGLHIMLLDVDPLESGQKVIVYLEFATAGIIEVEATVVPYAEIAP